MKAEKEEGNRGRKGRKGGSVGNIAREGCKKEGRTWRKRLREQEQELEKGDREIWKERMG